MGAECEGVWKKSLTYCLCVRLEIMRKNTEILVKASQSCVEIGTSISAGYKTDTPSVGHSYSRISLTVKFMYTKDNKFT